MVVVARTDAMIWCRRFFPSHKKEDMVRLDERRSGSKDTGLTRDGYYGLRYDIIKLGLCTYIEEKRKIP